MRIRPVLLVGVEGNPEGNHHFVGQINMGSSILHTLSWDAQRLFLLTCVGRSSKNKKETANITVTSAIRLSSTLAIRSHLWIDLFPLAHRRKKGAPSFADVKGNNPHTQGIVNT